jgi:methionyl aminopeptidase
MRGLLRQKQPIFLKSPQEIKLMREAGRLVAEAHLIVKEHMRPGVSTKQIDLAVEKFIRSKGCVPSFKGYRGFPASSCICVNEEMVHGIPGSRVLGEGDIVKVDIGVNYRGYHGDSVWTYGVGEIAADRQRLLAVSERAMLAGVAMAEVGKATGDIGAAMEKVALENGYVVSKEFGGHGVGRSLHEEPSVPNFGEPGKGVNLRAGMTIAIEPIVVMVDSTAVTLKDKWTVVSKYGYLSAQFEHSVAITNDGPQILTTL